MAGPAQTLQDSLTVGAPVMTTSGLHGRVGGLGDKTVDIEIAPGVVVTFARPAILEVRKPFLETHDVDTTGDDTPGGRRRPADEHPLRRRDAMANRSLPVGRYFGAFLLIVAVLYGLIFLTGSAPAPRSSVSTCAAGRR